MRDLSVGDYPDGVRRDGRADECTALEKPRGESLRGFESPSLRWSEVVF